MVRKVILFFGDITTIVISFFITLSLGFRGPVTNEMLVTHIEPFLLLYAIWILILYLFNFYDIGSVKPTIHSLRTFAVALLVSFVVGIIFFYAIPAFGISPKTNLVINIVSFGVLLFFWRRVYYLLFSRYFQKKTLFVGKNKTADELKAELIRNPQHGYEIAGTVDSFEEAQGYDGIETLIVALNGISLDPQTAHYLYRTELEVLDIAEAYERILQKIPINYVDEHWFIQNVRRSKRNGLSALLRSLTHRALAALILLITSPFFLIIALAIYLEDRGPIFYKQVRTGKNNKPFTLYKFRSMVVNAEERGAQWAGEVDARVTRVGRVIRKLHIDEIPQMINILRGELAFVGPRPERPEFVHKLEQEIPHYHLRHFITPGFTGWAQVKFRYARSLLDSHEKFQYDLYYIKNRNVFMDVGIMLRTVQIIFLH